MEEAFALAIHADAARNQVRLSRLDVAVALDASDAAGALKFAQDPLQFLLALPRQAKGAEQFGDVERDVSPLPEKKQKFGCEVFHVQAGIVRQTMDLNRR